VEELFPSCIVDCFIPKCTAEHGINFCADCVEFPCGKIEESGIYVEEAKKVFYEGSILIKEHGVEKFFIMRNNISHYTTLQG